MGDPRGASLCKYPEYPATAARNLCVRRFGAARPFHRCNQNILKE